MSNKSITPVADSVLTKLHLLEADYLDLLNESMNHAGYFKGKESHFKLVIVSSVFNDKRMVGRHQLVYQLLADEMTAQGGTIHALSIHAYTPDEWQKKGFVPNSPNCAGAN